MCKANPVTYTIYRHTWTDRSRSLFRFLSPSFFFTHILYTLLYLLLRFISPRIDASTIQLPNVLLPSPASVAASLSLLEHTWHCASLKCFSEVCHRRSTVVHSPLVMPSERSSLSLMASTTLSETVYLLVIARPVLFLRKMLKVILLPLA